jgi:hypothetical protein
MLKQRALMVDAMYAATPGMDVLDVGEQSASCGQRASLDTGPLTSDTAETTPSVTAHAPIACARLGRFVLQGAPFPTSWKPDRGSGDSFYGVRYPFRRLRGALASDLSPALKR